MTEVRTALGSVEDVELGTTLTHEHLFVNLMAERRGDGLLNDKALITDELRRFRDQGGGTIFELTPAELTVGTALDEDPTFTGSVAGQTRSPASVRAIQRVSEATGVNVVLATGRYRDPFLDGATIDRQTVAALANEMIRDIEEGFPETDVRAALIGEIGTDKWFASAREERVFRAAARAHRSTGVPIYTHAARWRVGLTQLEILQEEGVDPRRVAIGHADTVPDLDYVLELATAGVYVGLDTINNARPVTVGHIVSTIDALIRAGRTEQILLSHDVCLTSHLVANGGNGFGFVLGGLRQALAEHGIGDDEFNVMTVENPRRYLVG